MALRLNPVWTKRIKEDIVSGAPIDETTSFNKSSQFMISWLSNQGRLFKVYNLGAGVKRITTETDTCPCCKRKL